MIFQNPNDFPMKSYDVLFIHPPRTFQIDYDRKHASRSSNAFLPMGFSAIADYCKEEGGFGIRMVNVPLELHLKKRFSLTNYLKNIEFDVCALDLHWYLHSYGAVKVAEMVKRQNPNAKVVLGGFTATYYSHEILKNFPVFDAIIRGEGEVPFLRYLQKVKNGTELHDLPNLSYRDDSKIRETPITYIASELDHLNFTNLSFMDHYEEYFRLCEEAVIPFSIMIARGCPFNCPFCGGGRWAQRHVTKRKEVIFRSTEKVVADIKKLYEMRLVNTIFFGHGYYLNKESYWLEIFQGIQREKLDLGAGLEIWRLPFNRLLKEFSRTFVPDLSLLEFNIQAFSGKTLDRFCKHLDPTLKNKPKDVQDLIKHSKHYKIPLRLWVNIGNPYETIFDVLKGLKVILKLNIQTLFSRNNIYIYNSPITASPGSPAFENPEIFHIKLYQKSFQDFYDFFSKTSNKFGEMDQIINFDNRSMSKKLKFFVNAIYNILEYPMLLKTVSNTVVSTKKHMKRRKKHLNTLNSNKELLHTN